MAYKYFVEYNNNQFDMDGLTPKIKEKLTEEKIKAKDIKNINVYFQPETEKTFVVVELKDETEKSFEL